MGISSRFALLLAAVGATHAGAAEPLTDRQADAEKIGTVVQYAVPLSALALTFLLGHADEQGPPGLDAHDLLHLNGSPRHDLALAIGRSVVLTQGLKYAVDEQRPNGAARSFPSGHTSLAFSGAEFIRKEYGWGWGIPAYLAASYVGWSRVESKQHYTHDVLAGAVIGILANHDFMELRTRFGSLSLRAAPVDMPYRGIPGLRLELVF